MTFIIMGQVTLYFPIVAMSVDYKDKLWGGKFDWLDVVATILLPGIISFIVVLIAL